MKAKDNKTEVITIRVTPEIKTKLQALADKDHRTISNFLQVAIEKLLTEKKK